MGNHAFGSSAVLHVQDDLGRISVQGEARIVGRDLNLLELKANSRSTLREPLLICALLVAYQRVERGTPKASTRMTAPRSMDMTPNV